MLRHMHNYGQLAATLLLYLAFVWAVWWLLWNRSGVNAIERFAGRIFVVFLICVGLITTKHTWQQAWQIHALQQVVPLPRVSHVRTDADTLPATAYSNLHRSDVLAFYTSDAVRTQGWSAERAAMGDSVLLSRAGTRVRISAGRAGILEAGRNTPPTRIDYRVEPQSDK